MPQFVDVRAGGDAVFSRGVTLDGVAVRYHLRWLAGIERWTCRIDTPGGVALTSEQVVAPGGEVIWDRLRDDTPSGILRWEGPDPYTRDDMGTEIRLLYRTAAEIGIQARRTYRQIAVALKPPGLGWDSDTVTFDSTVRTFDDNRDA